jgi:hypothetical protein
MSNTPPAPTTAAPTKPSGSRLRGKRAATAATVVATNQSQDSGTAFVGGVGVGVAELSSSTEVVPRMSHCINATDQPIDRSAVGDMPLILVL